MAEQWRLLVVEGEENLSSNIVNSLQKDAYVVQCVKTETEAIRLLWSEEYDLVICSQQISGANGIDLLQWMRTYCPNTRMVMLAASGASVTRSQALEMGVASYLEMPLDLHALKEELRRLLHQTGFSASLDSFDLLDVIQIITLSQKSIALVVSTGLEEQGVLRFQNGELIWAEYGMLRGEEAFFALAAHKNGTVIHRPWSDQIVPNVAQPLSRLIFQALQYRSKYADAIQLSSEMEQIRPVDPLTLLPIPPTTSPGYLLDLDEEDDSPFQFVVEDVAREGMPTSLAFEPFVGSGLSAGSTNGQAGGIMGSRQENGQEAANSSEINEREWWEPTGTFPSIEMRISKSGELEKSLLLNGMNITPSTVHKTVSAQNSGLPSWLTDQPTDFELPVLRENTGQLPRTTQNYPPTSSPLPPISAMPPATPAVPILPQSLEAEWVAANSPATLPPSDPGLRKIKPDSSSYTGPQRTINPTTRQLTSPLRLAPVEGEIPRQAVFHDHPEAGRSVQPQGRVEQVRDPLQSLAALNKTTASLTNDVRTISYGVGTVPETPLGPIPATEKPVRRNYAALAAALQTVGYSVTGFVASAVVGLDGMPIAQVAVDELDISPQCLHFSLIMQGTLHALDLRQGKNYEHTVITSETQHILLRLVGNKRDVFQVLITTRETSPAESLEIMANVEAAIAAALY
jgi:DNA-binding response OmpR family regulator